MVNASLLRQLVPLASLTPTDRAELARQARLGSYQPGQVMFNRGEKAPSVVYLLSGEVELYSDTGTRVIKGGTPEALHPLAQGARRMTTATCLKPAQVVFVDREHMDLMLTWTQTSGVEVVEMAEEGGGDWMSALLQSQAFHRIPPGNIGQIFAAMKPLEVAAGEYVIREGDPGDYYYIVTEGSCQVLRRDAAGNEVEISRLGAGQGFGEEALVSGNPRNASVRALTPCALVRLSATDFERLLKAPILKEIAPEDIPADALLLDVRLPEEFRRGRLPDALNLPLARLREMAAQLESGRCYVVYCDSGRRSASATYLLSERGFDARLLAGGVPAEEMPVRG